VLRCHYHKRLFSKEAAMMIAKAVSGKLEVAVATSMSEPTRETNYLIRPQQLASVASCCSTRNPSIVDFRGCRKASWLTRLQCRLNLLNPTNPSKSDSPSYEPRWPPLIRPGIRAKATTSSCSTAKSTVAWRNTPGQIKSTRSFGFFEHDC